MCYVVLLNMAQSMLIRPLARCKTRYGSDDKHHMMSVSKQHLSSNLETRLTGLTKALNLLENLAALTRLWT